MGWEALWQGLEAVLGAGMSEIDFGGEVCRGDKVQGMGVWMRRNRGEAQNWLRGQGVRSGVSIGDNVVKNDRSWGQGERLGGQVLKFSVTEEGSVQIGPSNEKPVSGLWCLSSFSFILLLARVEIVVSIRWVSLSFFELDYVSFNSAFGNSLLYTLSICYIKIPSNLLLR